MLKNRNPEARGSAATKARIIAAAQQVFGRKGYSHAGLREIAGAAGVATSLLTKYYKNKAKLFEAALTEAVVPPATLQADRGRFGTALAGSVLDRETLMLSPAMMALSVGEAEAREAVIRVARQHILAPMTEWLQPPQAEARAISILMMTLGFALFSRDMQLSESAAAQQETARIFAEALQRIVDMG